MSKPLTPGSDVAAASALAIRMARLSGLDLKTVSGSGPDGRIQARDIRRALGVERGLPAPPAGSPESAEVVGAASYVLRLRFDPAPLFSLAGDPVMPQCPVSHALLFLMAGVLARHPDLLGARFKEQHRARGTVHLGFVPNHLPEVVCVLRVAGGLGLRRFSEAAAAVESRAQKGLLETEGSTGFNFLVRLLPAADTGHERHAPRSAVEVAVQSLCASDLAGLTLRAHPKRVPRAAAESFLAELERVLKEPRRMLL